jgi:hypothetical protein
LRIAQCRLDKVSRREYIIVLRTGLV